MSALRQMRLVSAKLENIFCYREAQVDFRRGVSVFAGANGSGKSSLLEALFFALFGSATGTITGRPLAEVLREGEKKGSLELTFEFGPASYTVRLVLRRSGERVMAEGKNCCLQRDDGQTWSGVKQIAAQIEGLLQLDSDDFANCLYVRQGEVDRLINVSSQQRQSTIDRLLRLTRLDEYQHRVKKVHTALSRRHTRLQGSLDTLKAELVKLEAQHLASQAADLRRALATLEAQKDQRTREASEHERALLTLERDRTQFARIVEQLEEVKTNWGQQDAELLQRKDEEQTLHHDVRHHEDVLAKLKHAWQARQREMGWTQLALTPTTPLEPLLKRSVQRHEDISRALGDKREQLATLKGAGQAQAASLKQQEGERATKRARQQSERAAFVRLERDLGQTLSALGVLAPSPASFDPQKQRDAQQHEVQTCGEALQQLRQEHVRTKDRLQAATKQQQQVRTLLQADRCPTCQQPVSEATLSTHTAQLEALTTTLGQQLETLAADVETARGQLERATLKLATIRKLEAPFVKWQEHGRQLDRLDAELKVLETQQHALDVELEQRKREEETLVLQCTRLKASLEEEAETFQFLQATLENREALERQRETVTRERQRLREFLRYSDKLRLALQQLEQRHQALKQQLSVHDHAAIDRSIKQHQNALKETQAQIQALGEQRDGVQQRLGQVETQLSHANELKEEHKQALVRQQTLKQVETEMGHVQTLYAEIKRAQRQHNMDALNHLFNHFFRLMEPGAAYDRALLNPECEIQIVRNDGALMSPSIMSGGERALINLALRAAVHQLISEAGGVMLPLFFDEPTVFLDEHHVQKLEFLFADLGTRVGQVIVVSHEASLVASADHEYRVHKDADNVGQVERVR